MNLKFLPKKLLVFFGDKGLSNSEANHQANMTKEIAEGVGREIDSLSSVHETLSYDGGKDIVLDSNEAVDLEQLKINAQVEGKLYALSAWLREAVKAKMLLLQIVKQASNGAFMIEDEKFPALDEQPPLFITPVKPAAKTEEDVIGDMDIKERAEYLTLEATAAHLGKKIHKGGKISVLRKDIQDFVPVRFTTKNSGTGAKDYPISRVLLYEPDAFDKVFFALQAEHRAAEQKLNGYKARIQNEVTVYNATVEKEYSATYNEARLIHDKLVSEYNAKHQSIQKEQQAFISLLESRRLEATKEISGWKIVVPNDLEEMLTFVKNFSK